MTTFMRIDVKACMAAAKAVGAKIGSGTMQEYYGYNSHMDELEALIATYPEVLSTTVDESLSERAIYDRMDLLIEVLRLSTHHVSWACYGDRSALYLPARSEKDAIALKRVYDVALEVRNKYKDLLVARGIREEQTGICRRMVYRINDSTGVPELVPEDGAMLRAAEPAARESLSCSTYSPQ